MSQWYALKCAKYSIFLQSSLKKTVGVQGGALGQNRCPSSPLDLLEFMAFATQLQQSFCPLQLFVKNIPICNKLLVTPL